MASASDQDGITMIESGDHTTANQGFCSSSRVVTTAQKVVAEFIGTYFLVFSGCGAAAVDKIHGGTITFPGICVTWGLIVMVMVYSLAHVSGAHFNPAVTLTFAVFLDFPWKEVPLYIMAQLMGSVVASGTLALMLNVTDEAFFGTVPVGSLRQSLAMEIVISFLLMFVICGVTTDTRAIGDAGGAAVGMTIMLNVFVAGPISGGSMNPARSIGPAVVKHEFRGLWVYVLGPIIGTILGAFCYNLIRFTKKPISELAKTGSFLKGKPRANSSLNPVMG